MQHVNIQLEQTWETIDEAIDYFLDIVLDLKALKRLPDPPSELYLQVDSPSMSNDDDDYDLTITLTSL